MKKSLLMMIAVATAGLLFGLVSILSAQQPDQPPAGPPGLNPQLEGDSARERVAERIRIMRAWRLTEVLELDQDTALELFALLDTHDALIRPEEAQLEQNARNLRQLLSAGDGDDEELSELTRAITQGHLRIEQLRVELINDSAGFLDPRQQAALMLFIPDFDREVRSMIRETRRQRRGQGPRGEGLRGDGPPGDGPRGDGPRGRPDRGDGPPFEGGNMPPRGRRERRRGQQ